MPIIYDITKDLRYKEGKLEGKLEGKREGKLEGMREGELKQARITVINMLKSNRFTLEEIGDFLEVPLTFIEKIQKELAENPDLV